MLRLTRDALAASLVRLNAPLDERERAAVAAFEPPRFTLRFPEPTTLPEDKCVDQRFTEIQFILQGDHRVTTGIQGAAWSDEEQAYLVHYEEVDWD